MHLWTRNRCESVVCIPGVSNINSTTCVLSSFYYPEDDDDNNLEKQPFRRRFPVDRLYELIKCQCAKIQKRTVKIVSCKVVWFVGLLAAQALVVYFVHQSRSSSHVIDCRRARQLPHHHMPSVGRYTNHLPLFNWPFIFLNFGKQIWKAWRCSRDQGKTSH